MNYIKELTRKTIINDLSHYYKNSFDDYTDDELNIFFTKHIEKHNQEIKMKDFYELEEKNLLIESLDGYVKVGEKIKKENLECYTLTLVDGRLLSGAFNHLVETERGWVKLIDLTKNDFVLTVDGFIKVKNIRQIKTQDVYDLECLHKNHRYLSNGISNHNTGKSYFTVMFMDWFKKNYDPYSTFDILTDSKILQEQYTNDYDFMNSLWGKGSYECDKHQTDCATGMEFCKLQGEQCEYCPYKEAKWKFDNGDIALTNFHLFLTYMLYMPNAWNRSSRVLIIDECHNFESVTCDFITTKISKPLLKTNGFTDDEITKVYNLFGKNPEDLTLPEFCEIVDTDFLNLVKTVMNRLSREAEENTASAKKLQSLANNFLKWESLLNEYNKLPDNWILEAELVKKYDKNNQLYDSYYEFIAQPIWADKYLPEKVWEKYDFVLFMSGTILDKNMFAQMNGIEASQSAYKAIDSPFKAENRPIYYFYNLGKQTYTTKEITWKKQLPVLKKILKKHDSDKGIIHTANYEIQGWVSNAILEDRILAHSSDNRNEVLNYHYQSKDATVLVSPSMITGVDLTEDYSRHQTLLKMPYPNLGSKKIKKRNETNKNWYSWKTVVDLVQSYGRSVRSKDDCANTYILDASFSNVLKYSDRYIPSWFKDAIKYIK